jgi:hypothetical protein
MPPSSSSEAGTGRTLPYGRAWNIGARTAHIAAMAVLVGGHAYDVPAARLYPALWATIGTGVLLVGIEAFSLAFRWAGQGRGLMVLAKLALLLVIPFAWRVRVPILLVVIALASVGSHMPARFRYYSISRFPSSGRPTD